MHVVVFFFFFFFFFLCVLRFYSPVSQLGSCRARSVYQTTLFRGQAQSFERLASIVYILLLETDNSPSLISRRERMTGENIS